MDECRIISEALKDQTERDCLDPSEVIEITIVFVVSRRMLVVESGKPIGKCWMS